MCEGITKEVRPGHVEATCETSGKPITIANEYGMFCEDMCDLEECKQDAAWFAENFAPNMLAVFVSEGDGDDDESDDATDNEPDDADDVDSGMSSNWGEYWAEHNW